MRLRLCALLLLLCPWLAFAAPVITDPLPAADAFTNSRTVTATVTGTGTLTVTVNGVTATRVLATDSFLAKDLPFVKGDNTVNISATDPNGTTNFPPYTIHFDDVKPVVTLELVTQVDAGVTGLP